VNNVELQLRSEYQMLILDKTEEVEINAITEIKEIY